MHPVHRLSDRECIGHMTASIPMLRHVRSRPIHRRLSRRGHEGTCRNRGARPRRPCGVGPFGGRGVAGAASGGGPLLVVSFTGADHPQRGVDARHGHLSARAPDVDGDRPLRRPGGQHVLSPRRARPRRGWRQAARVRRHGAARREDHPRGRQSSAGIHGGDPCLRRGFLRHAPQRMDGRYVRRATVRPGMGATGVRRGQRAVGARGARPRR
jgi:hypothetical protein